VAEHGERIQGVAFLHNATEFGVAGLREIERDARGLLFTGERRGAFLDHLRSKQLMSVAAQEVRERQQFVLLDEQQVAYRMVLNAVERAKRADHKEVVIVTGGPVRGRA
jgi:uncharacterized protein